MLNKRVHINPTFANDHWQLYSSMSRHKSVIRKLNSTLKKCVNAGMTQTDTHKAMCVLMRDNSKFGASDTEPRVFLEYILDKIYG